MPSLERLRLLHVFSTFAVGGPQVRLAALTGYFGDRAEHTILSMDGRYDCETRLPPGLRYDLLRLGNDTDGIVRRRDTYRRILVERRPDVLVSYNWGTIEWALANMPKLCRHIHFEDGFGPAEAEKQLWRRTVFRRMVLSTGPQVVVPSIRLATIARQSWHIPEARLHYIPNGVDIDRFDHGDAAALRASHGIAAEIPLLGTISALRPEKNLARLIRALAIVHRSSPAHLVLAGDGPSRAPLERLAEELGIAAAVTFLGYRSDTERILAGMDVFVLSSDTEQMPISVLEAMACAKPICSVDVGDINSMVSDENRQFIVAKDACSLAAALIRLIGSPGLIDRLGKANRRKVVSHYSLDDMFCAYDDLFFAERPPSMLQVANARPC